ncbi:hypothetical protein EVAR_42546_1 [Eumeta japonica]|uniref:Reverse transcriptase domain-containing protein n=1 Tax=Eumeta variegata TaxID=151549 RepID=A0A4C1WR16_EUMVA|nr:hypothetical protein EVAR_42546_1 [Eumeta japonica]
MDELPIKCFLYADDQVVHALWACGLQEMVIRKNDSVKKRGTPLAPNGRIELAHLPHKFLRGGLNYHGERGS